MTGSLEALVLALQKLPGVGVKSASRMAYHLLQHDRQGARRLAQSLIEATQKLRHCALCHTFSEDELCATCADPQRDAGLLCVLETPADQAVMERTGVYRGLYYVLMGRLSPLDGVGPLEIGLRQLADRLHQPGARGMRELILATSFTAEGEATAHAVAQMAQSLPIKVTRLARGVPIGSELEYVDLGTIAHALADRR